jgi:hypothetical protein
LRKDLETFRVEFPQVEEKGRIQFLVHIDHHLRYLENLPDGILFRCPDIRTYTVHHFKMQQYGFFNQIVLVSHILIQCFFGHAQLPRDIIHRNTFDAVPHKHFLRRVANFIYHFPKNGCEITK